jgi:hypothetical protein
MRRMSWNVHIIGCNSIAGFVRHTSLIHFRAYRELIQNIERKDEFESARLPSLAEDYDISSETRPEMEILLTIIYM